MKKHQTESNQRTFYKIMAHNLQKSQGCESIDRELSTVKDTIEMWKINAGGDSAINYIMEASGKTWMQFEDQMVAMYQCELSNVDEL